MSRTFPDAAALPARYMIRMELLTSLLSPLALAGAILVTLVAGMVKGAIGFAMPLIMISGMSLFLDPLLAVAALILPIVVSNIWQSLRGGFARAGAAVREYAVYIGIVSVSILISAQFLTSIPSQTLYLVIGVPVTLLCAIQLFGLRLVIPAAVRKPAELIIALIAGVLGGLTGTWGPPTVLYLVAIETPKAKQIVVQGVIYGLGSVMLLAGHLTSGVLNAGNVWLSALLVIPALLGQGLGFRIHDRIDQETFRKATLAVLLIAGLNLIRRGLFG